MSDLRKRFEKETGKKVEITAHFDCEDSECDYDVPVDIWNNEYIMWLENLANGVNTSDSGLHLQRVSNNEVAVCECRPNTDIYCETVTKCNKCNREVKTIRTN